MTINNYFGNLSTLVKRGAAAALFGSMAALLVSCGGSGTTGGNPLTNGPLSILPSTGSLYAYTPTTINVAGGIGPYFVTSNEQTVLPLNFTLNGNSFTVVPNQVGVYGTLTTENQSEVGATAFRIVTVTARDSTGKETTATYNVLQSFLTGYGLSIQTAASCSASAVTVISSLEACAGADSLISLVNNSSGVRYKNKQMRLTATFGAFAFIVDSTGITGPTYDTVSDSTGGVTARIRVTPNTTTQYAQFRLIDVATGEYRDISFIIKNANGSNVPLSLLPSKVSLGGPTTAACGTGLVNLFVFGGIAPYRASTSFPNSISITPPLVDRSGDAFSVQVFNPNVCLSPGSVVVTDSLGAFVTLEVTTTPGTAAPVLPLRVAPSALCVPDGGTGVISISGGNANKVINSTNPGLATAIPTSGSGNFTSTINASGAGGAIGTLVTLTVDDGGTSALVSVTRKTTCP